MFRFFLPDILFWWNKDMDMRWLKVIRAVHDSVLCCRSEVAQVCRSSPAQRVDWFADERRRRRRVGRGQAAADGVQRWPVVDAAARVRRQPVLDRGPPAATGRRARTARVADQDLVPEQARQVEEGERHAQPAGDGTDGAGTVQPLHGAAQTVCRRRRKVALYRLTATSHQGHPVISGGVAKPQTLEWTYGGVECLKTTRGSRVRGSVLPPCDFGWCLWKNCASLQNQNSVWNGMLSVTDRKCEFQTVKGHLKL